ncbi:STAS domain-containing protein [Streptomyces canus]|uniref:STAS domain-containing protein n=1 Tax=Streptomyces canus TaxID=58343 RepID=UPI00225C3661|nr:STAS domain-containing protein [Streptomyces canus]MCX4856142.1 STAS domain-containing protein [Streptomyces canus]
MSAVGEDTVTDTHGAARQPRQLSIGHTTVDGIPVITVRGEIDHTVKDMLSEALLAYNDAAPPRTVVDLNGVTFMDSSGINVLIAAHKRMSDADGWLRLAGPQASVLRLIELVGLNQVIACHPTVEQALTP